MKVVIPDIPQHVIEQRRRQGNDRFDEVWEGVYHMNPPPRYSHQELESELEYWLRTFWGRPLGNRVNHQIALTPPDNLENWVHNFRTPDLVLLTPDRFHIIQEMCFAGAPTVAVEIHSPGDEAYEKLPFYGELGVPEVWIIHRESRRPELRELSGGAYELRTPDAEGWLRSAATGLELRHVEPHHIVLRLTDDPSTERALPEGE